MSSPIPCIEIFANTLSPKDKNLVLERHGKLIKKGLSERDANRQIAVEEFEKVKAKFEELKVSVGIKTKTEPTKNENTEAKVKEITDSYNTKIEEAKNKLNEEAEKAKVINETTNEGTTTSDEPIPSKKDGTPKEDVGEDTQGAGGGKEPPKEPIKNDFLYSPNEQKRTSGLMRHLLESENLEESVKREIKDKGLDKYEVANNAEAREVASQIVKSLDKDGALQVARMEDMHPSVRSAIYAEVIDNAFRAEQEAIKKGDKEAQMEAAAEWASVSKEYDKKLTAGGQFTAYAAHFYKQSPMGFVLKANEQIAKKFEDFMKDKDADYEKMFEEITATNEGKALLNEKVEALRKEERKAERATKKAKVHKQIDDFAKKWADKLTPDSMKGSDVKKSGVGAEELMKSVAATMKLAYDGGELAVKVIKDAIDYVSKELGTSDWDKKAFTKEAELFLGGGKSKSKGYKESDSAHAKRIEYLEKELERIRGRKSKEPTEKKESTRELPEDERLLIEEISAEQDKWDAEKDTARKTAMDYQKMETERNRQLKRVGEIKDKISILEGGKLPETKKVEYKKDTPEIEELKAEAKELEKQVRESIAHETKMTDLEKELERIKSRKSKEPKENIKKEIKEDEKLKRDEIEAEQKKWNTEKNIETLTKELERVKNRQKKVTEPKEKKQLSIEENDLIKEIKSEKEKWAKEVEPQQKLIAGLKEAQKSIEEYERRLREKDISKADKDESYVTPELKKLRDIRDAKRKQYEQMKKKMTSEQDKIDSLNERTDELNRRMDENDFSDEAYVVEKPLTEKEKEALDKYKKVKEVYDEAKKKSAEYIDKKSKQYLDMVRSRLKNMNDKQKEEFIRRVSKKIIENGGLRYDEFKKELADVMGFKELTPEQIVRAEELTKDINGVDAIEDAMVANGTVENVKNYIEARRKAAESQNELYNMVARKSDIMQTFKSWFLGGLLGVPSLVINTTGNIAMQGLIRLPKSVLLNIGEQGGRLLSKGMHKLTGSPLYHPNLNIIDAQKGYFKTFKPALSEAIFHFKKGTESKDLFAKNEYQSSLSPRLAAEELAKYYRGEIYLTKTEIVDRYIRKSIFAKQANIILKSMQFGDVIPRWMAEGAKSEQIARNELGITDPIELDVFFHSPEKTAKKKFLEQGKSVVEATKLAAEIKNRIVFEGQKAVFQQDNVLKQLSSSADRGLTIKKDDQFGTRALKNVGSAGKTMTFPFVGIPANLAWEGFKLVNPEISFGLSISQMAISVSKGKKGDIAGAKEYFEMAKDNLAHGVLGLSYVAAAVYLVNGGFVRSSNDEKTDKKERAGESVYGKQNQINMGKLMGGNDFWVDTKYFPLIGTVVDTKAKQKDAALKEKSKTGVEEDYEWLNDFSERIGYSGVAQLNNLVFNNGSKIVEAMNGGDAPFRSWMSQTTNGITNLFTGGTYASFSKAMLPEQVVVKGDGIIEDIKNNQKQRNILLRLGIDMFGGNGTPPSKISIWGEKYVNDRSVTGILGNMLGWEKGSKDVFGAIIYDDFKRTGNPKFFPMPEDAKFSVNGKQVELNLEQKQNLDILVGQARKTLVGAVVSDMVDSDAGVYSKIKNDEDKLVLLQKAYDIGKEIGYKKFIEKYPQFQPVEKDVFEKMEDKAKEENKKRIGKQLNSIISQ